MMEQTHFELLENVIAKLFPTGSRLLRNPDDAPPEERYYVIHGWNCPRWIVPQNPKYGEPVVRQWKPTPLSSSIIWEVLRRAYTIGALGVIPGVVPIGISTPGESGWENRGWDRKAPPSVVINLGWHSLKRKAIATFVDTQAQRARMLIKVPIGADSPNMILHEAKILKALSEEKPGFAPKLLFVNEKEGIAGQEAIIGCPPSRKFTRLHLDYLKGLRLDGEETSLMSLADVLAERLKRLSHVEIKTKNLLEGLIEKVGDPAIIPSVWAHGDFLFINLLRINSERLVAVDWEHSFRPGPPLLDYFKHFIDARRRFGTINELKRAAMTAPFIDEYASYFGLNEVLREKLLYYYICWDAIGLIEKEGDLSFGMFDHSLLSRLFNA